MKRYYTPNKHVINENNLLRMKYNDLIRYILYLQHELDKLSKICHEHHDNENDYNQICHKTYKILYENTFKKFEVLKSLGYNIKYIWESDWKKFNNNVDKHQKILTF